MTQQRDLKRRIRERQQQTGEAYSTARGHVLAQRDPGDANPVDAIPVVEPLDVTETAALLGLRCRTTVFPLLAAKLSPRILVERVRDALLVCESERLRSLAFHSASSPMPRRWLVDRAGTMAFLERVGAGIGGPSPSGMNLAIHVDGVPVICTAWHPHAEAEPTLVLSTLGDVAWGTL
jgi:hypothetical protein|nr:hypothetical protein [Kofleriaceae bacterium]